MGGFNSVTEGLSSGNSITASGVSLGNAASENSGLAFTSASPASFAMPETDGGSGNWTSMAFAPSSTMTQQMPEQQDIRLQSVEPDKGTGWRPNQGALEKASRNLLDNTVPKPSSGFGGGLLTDNGENERKVNPIVSKLAREHRENPVHLRGSLLGSPETPDYKMSGFMPTKDDELPKLPKIDWTIYDRHRIDGKTRISHDDWARVINLTKDFGGIIPTMVRTIQDGGDGGRGNVADVIGRVAQSNPDHARFFQRELSTALGGEMVPARMARMVGEPQDNAEAPGLLGPSKPSQYDFELMRKDYWQNVETYKTELAQKQQGALQQDPSATKEPRVTEESRSQPTITEPPAQTPEPMTLAQAQSNGD